MSITQDILALSQSQANIQATQQHAQLMQAQTNALNTQAQVNARTRIIAQQFGLAQENAAAASPGGPGAPAQQPTGIMGTPEMQAVSQRIQQRTKDFQNYQKLANDLRAGGGDLKLAQQYDDNARQAQVDISTEQQRMLATKKDMIGTLASAAGSATADNWNDVRATLDQTAPGWDKGKDLDFDPLNAGQVTWGPRTQRAMAALADQGMTAYQQTESQWRAQQESRLSQAEAREQEREKVYESDVASRSALRRARIDAIAHKQDAPTKAPTVKDPTMHEVSDLGADLQDQYGLSGSQSALMARDILTRRNELRATNPQMSVEEAQAQASQEADARVQKGQNVPWYKPGTSTATSYNRIGKVEPAATGSTSAPADKQAAAIVAPFTKAKIPVEYTNGVLTSKGGPVPMTDDQYNALPSGTVFLAPDGKKHRKP